MRRILRIQTPENVYIEHELAGLGSRFVAMVIDLLIQLGLYILIAIAMVAGGFDFNNFTIGISSMNSFVLTAGIILIFLISFGYFVFFDMILNGQSPGKKAVKLRVIKQNGEPVGFFDSLTRNILRIADMLPAFNLAGAAFIVFTRNYKRIGDFAANTVVVRFKKETAPLTLDEILPSQEEQLEDEKRVNIYPVNNTEYEVLKEFLSRKDTLGERRPVFAYHLNLYFLKKFHLEEPVFSDPYEFFREILRLNAGV